MNIDEVINGWTFEKTIKTAKSLMEAETNMFKWDVIRHLRNFAEAYREQLKEYQQLEEQGRLVKLPCEVGDMLYYPEKLFDIVVPVRLNEIIISFLGIDTYSYQYNCCSFDECGDVYEEYDFDTNDFGKSIFLTKAEAEAKLEELRGEEG